MTPAIGVADCHCLTLRSAARRISNAYDQALAPTGLRLTQFAILSAAAEAADTSVNGLAKALELDRTTLGKNLRPLVRDRLIAIVPDPADRRARQVRLTDRGWASLRRAVPLWQAAQRAFEAANGAEQATELRDELRTLRAGGDALAEAPAGAD